MLHIKNCFLKVRSNYKSTWTHKKELQGLYIHTAYFQYRTHPRPYTNPSTNCAQWFILGTHSQIVNIKFSLYRFININEACCVFAAVHLWEDAQ